MQKLLITFHAGISFKRPEYTYRFSTKFPSRKLVSVIAKDKYPCKLHWKTVTQMSDLGFNLLSPVGASLVLLAATNLMMEYIWLC